ncbi:conserved hypothetical protein [Acinetobacter sp. 8I-beige]|uniref:hypothetical protein n=1 Tax=unclassified Acinetobacter TaxID=196816 RepID=UPI0009954284|nr:MULTISPECIES: hypothetical protein [unclassified Acinetobacter]OOW08310.1 hypothetical protein MF4642_14185 [Acinetobacter sp. MF4642]VXA83124.1 conserved hypothetical protein [Acinetobacter sp. 8I-beige]
MRYLSCKEIYDAIKEWGIKETNTREYAYEFQLKNGQYIYVKRLLDTQKRNPEPLRLMIHPCFIALKEDLLSFENIEFSFEEMGNMNSAFAQFPKSSQSQCDENPTKYGIGVNFQDKRSLLKLIVFIESV